VCTVLLQPRVSPIASNKYIDINIKLLSFILSTNVYSLMLLEETVCVLITWCHSLCFWNINRI